MAQTKTTLIAAALVLSVSAPVAAQRRADWNPTLDSVKQPVVQRTDYVIDVATGGAGVSDSELHRLAQWFDSLRLGYGDRVAVDTGSYDDARARQDVGGVAAEYGLLLSEGAPVSTGGVQPGSVRVIVSRSIASVPGCPDWSEAPEIGNRISTGSNYGCATNSNLAAMVADPGDLVLGQSGSSAVDATAAAKAVSSYRTRALTGASGAVKAESSKGSK